MEKSTGESKFFLAKERVLSECSDVVGRNALRRTPTTKTTMNATTQIDSITEQLDNMERLLPMLSLAYILIVSIIGMIAGMILN